ncbi:MAG: hypothetical protein A2W90_23515 [Bacteroidetes bacterium GWF2_42_66]|nr:MAG: hypothetical protein A2W92_20090 [Bacteroidetes bacterium GWA2_42_15]OFY00337.1 MAG: hypothetical protein A2W89_14150 [Bacteroidetes bacterium GWE2_42_39]OFY47093.1 MAG: hypothetical protein A2W90_23515 [Bacteroidetes bacterium GWF2_42_66]HBL76733.1 hypothetical protein [Prolixibacteraceae bacterium]HCR91693.1 hypothetical protein [Prolixibacteraceae bacterium]
MKKTLFAILIFSSLFSVAQTKKDSINTYKKRVLEAPEIDILMSYYHQDGDHSSVGGGIGDESLDDITPTIVITLPLNDDDVLTIDAGLSAYTSASSSNINPFNNSGASRGGDDDDEDDEEEGEGGGDYTPSPSTTKGSPWVASSGASRSDELYSFSLDYSHSSDSRDFIWGIHTAYSQEYDYNSIGFGGSIAQLFNQKNTEISLKTQVYLDQWKPIYPTELHEFSLYGDNFLNSGYFSGMTVLDESGNASTQYYPNQFSVINDKKRNSYSASVSFSQIISKRMQASLFFDLIYQEGLLSTPYHRIHFADKPNYYIGTASDIPNYTSRQNQGVFRLSDNIERLPGTRLKTPFGARINYYISETLKLRTYYRYYSDDWGITSHTASIELPIKLSQSFTLSPSYRYYQQTAANWFAPFETHLSTEKYYTSDHDLANFQSNQWGIGLSYTDIFTQRKIYKFGLKNINLKYSHYNRSDGLKANIVSFGVKFVFE